MTAPEEPVDPADVAEDNAYVEELRAGENPGDWLGHRFAALRDETQGKS